MNLLLFILTILVSFIVVRIGAVAFELTGLEWSLAKFQALSCFSGTGFTTREAELITGHPQRRRIASALMVLGHAGLVTLIATLANAIRPPHGSNGTTLFFNWSVSPVVAQWANLLTVIIVGYIIYLVLSRVTILQRITEYMRRRIMKTDIVQRVTFEQLTTSTGGYGVANVAVTESTIVAGKTLRNSSLREHDISVLAIERQGEMISNPRADTRIMPNDRLICYGKMDTIRKEFSESLQLQT
ncbi:MAG: TrkA C-terminal domain-containing protein [Lentisphaerae bacterium]|nr:TrkA C-terminal domain-containing protein [Lentisphaerota bacterium]